MKPCVPVFYLCFLFFKTWFSWCEWGIREIYHKLFMGLDDGSLNMGRPAVTYLDNLKSV